MRIEKVIEDTIEATFMQCGFRADRHREAVMRAIREAGYRIVSEDDWAWSELAKTERDVLKAKVGKLEARLKSAR